MVHGKRTVQVALIIAEVKSTSATGHPGCGGFIHTARLWVTNQRYRISITHSTYQQVAYRFIKQCISYCYYALGYADCVDMSV